MPSNLNFMTESGSAEYLELLEILEATQIKCQELLDENHTLKSQEIVLIEALESSNHHSMKAIHEEKEKTTQQESVVKGLLDQTQKMRLKFDEKEVIKENNKLRQENETLRSTNEKHKALHENYNEVVREEKNLLAGIIEKLEAENKEVKAEYSSLLQKFGLQTNNSPDQKKSDNNIDGCARSKNF